MDIVFSTRNPINAEQVKVIFGSSPFSILTLADAGIQGEAVEDGATLEENALKKALFAHRYGRLGSWSMADDTGLFVDALHGEPGVCSARWAGEGAPTEEVMAYILKRLEGVTDRSARFATVAAVVSPTLSHRFFRGEVWGKILEVPRIRPRPGMPYSSIFVPEGHNLTWAEMSVEMENSLSHRGEAFRRVRRFFEYRYT